MFTFETQWFGCEEWKRSSQRKATWEEAAKAAVEWMYVNYINDSMAAVRIIEIRE